MQLVLESIPLGSRSLCSSDYLAICFSASNVGQIQWVAERRPFIMEASPLDSKTSLAWDVVPYHVLLDIFSYLGKDAIQVSTVCKYWRSVAYTYRDIWSHINIKPGYFLPIEDLNDKLSPISVCKNLTLSFYLTSDEQLSSAISILRKLSENQDLQYLYLQPLLHRSSCETAFTICNKKHELITRLVTALTTVIKNVKSLQGFNWGGGYWLRKWQDHIIQSLQVYQPRSLSSLSLLGLSSALTPDPIQFLNSSQFSYFNLGNLSLNYVQLSEELLLVLSRNSTKLQNLTLFIENTICNAPRIRNQVWRCVRRRLPNLRVSIYCLCLTDLRIAHSSFTIEHRHQQQMNHLVSSRFLPSELPLSTIHLHYCQPDPLSCLIQYLADSFSSTLEEFCLVEHVDCVPMTDDLNSTNWLARYYCTSPNTTITDSDYLSLFSCDSSYQSLDTSDLDALSCDSHDFGQDLASDFEAPDSVPGLSKPPPLYTVTASCSSSTNLEQSPRPMPDAHSNPAPNVTPRLVCDMSPLCTNSNRPDNDPGAGCSDHHRLYSLVPSSSSTHLASPALVFAPNMYKSPDDVNPDPFVMFAWRCRHLTRFTFIGYWFNVADMKAFSALRGSSLKQFHIPRSCVSVDDQPWPICLNEDFAEISRNLGYFWTPISDDDLPPLVWGSNEPDTITAFTELDSTHFHDHQHLEPDKNRA